MDRRLRIIQVVHAFPPALGGIETHAYELSRELASTGADVVVHTSAQAGGEAVDAELSREGVKVKRHFAIKLPFFSSLVLIPCLPVFVALEKGDVVCSHGFGGIVPFAAAIGAKLSGKKFYWTVHGLPKFKGPAKWLAGAYGMLIAPVISACSTKIICVSQTLADEAGKKMGSGAARKIVVIPNGIGKEFREAGEKGADWKKESAQADGKNPADAGRKTPSFVILFAGRLDRSKGVFMLLDAFEKFHSLHKDSALKFVGPDEGQKGKLAALAKEKGLPVEFGTMPRDKMPGVYSSASVCVLPSEYEGFGLSVLESWACDTPAISTHVGVAPQFLREAFGEETAGVFLFEDEESLLACLERVYSSREEMKKRWAAEARKALAKYAWEEAAQQTIRLINEEGEGRTD
ncbi:MAG: glycosyltransferase family 4 protein [Candidatus Micrarchaeota archaeon]